MLDLFHKKLIGNFYKVANQFRVCHDGSLTPNSVRVVKKQRVLIVF